MATPLNHTGFQLTTFNPAQTITWLPEHSREGGISVSLIWTTGTEATCSLLPCSPTAFHQGHTQHQPGVSCMPPGVGSSLL